MVLAHHSSPEPESRLQPDRWLCRRGKSNNTDSPPDQGSILTSLNIGWTITIPRLDRSQEDQPTVLSQERRPCRHWKMLVRFNVNPDLSLSLCSHLILSTSIPAAASTSRSLGPDQVEFPSTILKSVFIDNCLGNCLYTTTSTYLWLQLPSEGDQRLGSCRLREKF